MGKKKQRIGHISKVQPNMLHSMTQVSMTLTLCQGQRSRSKFSQNGLNTKQLATSLMPFLISPTNFIISIITAFCDSFGRCPLVCLFVLYVCLSPNVIWHFEYHMMYQTTWRIHSLKTIWSFYFGRRRKGANLASYTWYNNYIQEPNKL